MIIDQLPPLLVAGDDDEIPIEVGQNTYKIKKSDLLQEFIKKTGGAFTGNVSIGGTLGVTGDTNLGGNLDLTGNATVGGTLDIVSRRCAATLLSAGWYRAVVYNAYDEYSAQGSSGEIVDIDIICTANNNCGHHIKLFLDYGRIAFLGENSYGTDNIVDKIRYVFSGSKGYIDIHYTGSAPGGIPVHFSFNVTTRIYANSYWEEGTLENVADAPIGENLLASYTFSVFTDDETTLTACEKTFTFRKKNGVVYIDAPDNITPSTSGINVIGTLPQGFRPAFVSRFAVANRDVNEYKTIVIDTAGNVNAVCYTSIGVSTPFSITGSYIAQ